MYGAKADSAPCVTLLANARADLELVDREFGTTAFLIACEHGCASSISALAAVGANILAIDKDGAMRLCCQAFLSQQHAASIMSREISSCLVLDGAGSSGKALAAGEQPPHDHVLKLLESCVCDVCAEPCPTCSVLLPNDNTLCVGCFEAQKQGPAEEQDLCRAAKLCAGGRIQLDCFGQPTPAPWDPASSSPRQASGGTAEVSSASAGSTDSSHVLPPVADPARRHAPHAGASQSAEFRQLEVF